MTMKEDHLFRSRLLSRLWKSWKSDFTESGRALIIGGIVATSLGSFGTSVDTYILLGFFLCFGIAGLVIAGLFRPKVKLSHSLPKRLVCSEPASFTVSIQNVSSRKAIDLVIQPASLSPFFKLVPESVLVPVLMPGEQKDVHFSLCFLRRGSFIFGGFYIDTTFPLGFFRLGTEHYGEIPVLVYPSFSPLDTLNIPTGRKHQPGGVALASVLGDSMEYLGNREYQQGDRLKDIDWRSWARVFYPVVREYQEEFFCRIALVLDTHLSQHKKKSQDFESALSLGASIADYLSRQEYLIDIFAAGPQIYVMEAGRSLAHLDQVLEVLACLEPCKENPFHLIEPVVMERIEMLTTVMVILLDMEPSKLAFLERIAGMGVGMKVFVCNSELAELPPLPFESHAIDIQLLQNNSTSRTGAVS